MVPNSYPSVPPSPDYERGYKDGIDAVLYIRCMEHRAVPQLNKSEGANRGECPICPPDPQPFGPAAARDHISRLRAELDKEINKWRHLDA